MSGCLQRVAQPDSSIGIYQFRRCSYFEIGTSSWLCRANREVKYRGIARDNPLRTFSDQSSVPQCGDSLPRRPLYADAAQNRFLGGMPTYVLACSWCGSLTPANQLCQSWEFMHNGASLGDRSALHPPLPIPRIAYSLMKRSEAHAGNG